MADADRLMRMVSKRSQEAAFVVNGYLAEYSGKPTVTLGVYIAYASIAFVLDPDEAIELARMLTIAANQAKSEANVSEVA